MATLVFTVAAGGAAPSSFRAIGKAIEKACLSIGDANPTGASMTMTLDNAPATGVGSVVVAGGGLPTQVTYLAG